MSFPFKKLRQLSIFFLYFFQFFILGLSFLVRQLLDLIKIPFLMLIDLLELYGFEHVFSLQKIAFLLLYHFFLFLPILFLLLSSQVLFSFKLLLILFNCFHSLCFILFHAFMFLSKFVVLFDLVESLLSLSLLLLLFLSFFLFDPHTIFFCDLLEDSFPYLFLFVLIFKELFILSFIFFWRFFAKDKTLFDLFFNSCILIFVLYLDMIDVMLLFLFFELQIARFKVKYTLAQFFHSGIEVFHFLLLRNRLLGLFIQYIWLWHWNVIYMFASFGTFLALLAWLAIQL